MRTDLPHDSDAVDRVRERKQIADAGVSDRTPAILIGETWVVIATAVLVVLAFSFLAVRLAT
jgi:hypothetical protein